MRLHRGSSKDARGTTPTTGSLPLSALPSLLTVTVEIARAATSAHHAVEVPRGTLVRDVVRSLGVSPEGCMVLVEETPVPLDTPIDAPTRITVVPTFSGG